MPAYNNVPKKGWSAPKWIIFQIISSRIEGRTLPVITRLRWKDLQRTNTLAYFASVKKIKSFLTLTPGANVKKLLLSVIYEFLQYARVFVPVKLFQPSLMFVGNAGAKPIEETFICSTLG
jgi:hypothetical protein